MRTGTGKSVLIVVIAVFSLVMVGCSGMEKRHASRSGYLFYHAPLVKADQALDEARRTGKDRECPAEFNAAKAEVDNAYSVYGACRTNEAIDLANEATRKIKALCPAKPVAVAKPVEVILVSEPKAEEQVIILASEPKVEKRAIILALEDIHFDFDKSTLTPEAQVILKRSITRLKENPKAEIRIAGYASASGTDAYNQKLSERRARAVEEYLVNEGIITRDRLSSIVYGETNPAMYEAAPKEVYSNAAKANMRVLFEVIVK
ncbi:MAG: OmpA family protein [Thermodesulfobacteriota bacterium]|nr:OmpA family protein [Thermodesulfobacteriota bacterium]